jgi:hypothetical protein
MVFELLKFLSGGGQTNPKQSFLRNRTGLILRKFDAKRGVIAFDSPRRRNDTTPIRCESEG